MKRFYSFLLLLVGACTFAADPASLDSGGQYAGLCKMSEEGRSETARLILQTMVNTYGNSPQATAAQHAIDAGLLFEDGQARLIAGKYGTARLAFQALISVYPESPLIQRATEAMRAAEELEQAQIGPTIESLRFEKIHRVTVQEILERFDEREIAIGVEKPYQAKAVEEAKTALKELLAEKGIRNPRVEAIAGDVSPRRIAITFRVGQD